MTRMGFAKRIEGALPRLTRVTVAVAMAGLLALAGCATEEEPVGVEASVSEAVEEAPDQDAVGAPVEPEQEAQAPEPEPVVSALESYAWDELSQISAEIAAAENEEAAIEVAKQYELCTPDGRLDGTQVKSVTLSDGTQTTVQIAGFAHDNKTEGGKAGITFIFGDAIASHDMNSDDSNDGGWEDSQMRSWLESDVAVMLPHDLAEKIVAVDKLTNNVGKTKKVSSVSTTSDSLWLYSAVEVRGIHDHTNGGVYNDIENAEGSEYKLFSDMGIEADSESDILVKTYQGNPINWWYRTPEGFRASDFNCVRKDGLPCVSSADATEIYGVVPGFCI